MNLAQPVHYRTNLYATDCAKCGERVPVFAGLLSKQNGAWKVHHKACIFGRTPFVAIIQEVEGLS